MAVKTKTCSSHIKLVKHEFVKCIEIYNKFINWVIGEFDLYLKIESKDLKVYFPSGWFQIGFFIDASDGIMIEIKIEGKSKVTCEILMNRLEGIFRQVLNCELSF